LRRGRKHSLLVYDDNNEINFSELGIGSKNQEQQGESTDEKEEEEQENNNVFLDIDDKETRVEEKFETTVVEKKSESPKVKLIQFLISVKIITCWPHVG